MDVLRYGFLVATLGEDGATALSKAAERSPVLGPVLVPRAILAWLQLQQDANYEGELPGVTNSYLSFQKASGFQKTLTTGTPTPDSFTGVIAVGDKSYGFEDASALQTSPPASASRSAWMPTSLTPPCVMWTSAGSGTASTSWPRPGAPSKTSWSSACWTPVLATSSGPPITRVASWARPTPPRSSPPTPPTPASTWGRRPSVTTPMGRRSPPS